MYRCISINDDFSLFMIQVGLLLVLCAEIKENRQEQAVKLKSHYLSRQIVHFAFLTELPS